MGLVEYRPFSWDRYQSRKPIPTDIDISAPFYTRGIRLSAQWVKWHRLSGKIVWSDRPDTKYQQDIRRIPPYCVRYVTLKLFCQDNIFFPSVKEIKPSSLQRFNAFLPFFPEALLLLGSCYLQLGWGKVITMSDDLCWRAMERLSEKKIYV